MSARLGTRRPPRGFAWPLAPLLRKAEWELDAARLHLARQAAAADAAEAASQQLDRTRREQLAALARMTHSAPEPRVHQAAMHFLAQLDARVAAAKQQHEVAAAQARGARADCRRCQQHLKGLLSLHQQAIAAQLREQARCEAKDADAGWLVGHGARVADAHGEWHP